MRALKAKSPCCHCGHFQAGPSILPAGKSGWWAVSWLYPQSQEGNLTRCCLWHQISVATWPPLGWGTLTWGEKSFIHSIEVILQSDYHWKGNKGAGRRYYLKSKLCSGLHWTSKDERGKKAGKEVNGTESKLWIPNTLAWSQFWMRSKFPWTKNVWGRSKVA